MISRILKSTQGKPCSCPDGKVCTGCKKKRVVKPQVFVEEPRRLTIPIVVSHYRQKPSTTVQVVEKPRRWAIRKREASSKKPTVCQWYKRRKALRELKRDHERRKKREKEENRAIARRERELEVLEILKREAAETAALKREPSPVKTKVFKTHEKKEKKVKAVTTTAKPQATSKYITVKRTKRYDSLSNRFVNFCYRLCCQFYCYLTCIFIIGFAIIYFL